MVVVGPEDPGKGFMTSLNDVALSDIPVIGPSKMCATRRGKNLPKF
jgi:hypothetical protein